MWSGVYVPPYRRDAQDATRRLVKLRDQREDRDLLALRAMRAERELELRIKEQEINLMKLMHEAEMLELEKIWGGERWCTNKFIPVYIKTQ